MKWTIELDGGPRRVNHAAVAIGDLIFSFGGYCSGENYDVRKPIDVHILDTVTYRWRPVIPTQQHYHNVPYQRYGHTAVVYQKKVYICGGRNDIDGASSVLHQFDPVTCQWQTVACTGRAPPARDGHSACVIDDLMLIFGGFEEEYQRFSQETYIFCFNTAHWMELKTYGSAPSWRDFHTATTLDRRMYVFGGRSDQLGQFHSSNDVYFSELRFLDLKDCTWYEPTIRGPTRPTGRRSHSAWCYDKKLYIFGGFSGTSNRHFDDLFEFCPEQCKWTKIEPFGKGPAPRRRQCTVLVGDRLFLFGGTKPCRSPKSNSIIVQTGLADLSDLYVLDYSPNLKQLALSVVIKSAHFDTYLSISPSELRTELLLMTVANRVSGPRTDLFG